MTTNTSNRPTIDQLTQEQRTEILNIVYQNRTPSDIAEIHARWARESGEYDKVIGWEKYADAEERQAAIEEYFRLKSERNDVELEATIVDALERGIVPPASMRGVTRRWSMAKVSLLAQMSAARTKSELLPAVMEMFDAISARDEIAKGNDDVGSVSTREYAFWFPPHDLLPAARMLRDESLIRLFWSSHASTCQRLGRSRLVNPLPDFPMTELPDDINETMLPLKGSSKAPTKRQRAVNALRRGTGLAEIGYLLRTTPGPIRRFLREAHERGEITEAELQNATPPEKEEQKTAVNVESFWAMFPLQKRECRGCLEEEANLPVPENPELRYAKRPYAPAFLVPKAVLDVHRRDHRLGMAMDFMAGIRGMATLSHRKAQLRDRAGSFLSKAEKTGGTLTPRDFKNLDRLMRDFDEFQTNLVRFGFEKESILSKRRFRFDASQAEEAIPA